MLEKEITINHMDLFNRIVMPPMASGKSNPDGTVTDELISYYTDRAERTGLIITEHAYIAPQGKASPNQMSIALDTDIPGLAELADAVHKTGAKIIVQINHAGSAAKQDDPEADNLAPSAVLRPGREGKLPRAMSEEEIQTVIRQFAAAAERVQKAGFDGVEIHSAHSYLLNQFYSPLTNRRNDPYGGFLENRLRIHTEVLQAVRERTGKDFMISVRLGGCDYLEGGSTVADAVKAAKILEENGADMISVTGGMRGYVHPDNKEPGYFSDMSVPVKDAVSVPVLLTGGICEPADAERLLLEGRADLIGIGRQMLKDPLWSVHAFNR